MSIRTGTVSAREDFEMRIVRHTVEYLALGGWKCSAIDDGDGWTTDDIHTTESIIASVFSVDEARVRFVGPGGTDGRACECWIFFVMGNDSGENIIADYSYRPGSTFEALMNEINDWVDQQPLPVE